jgi:hypothetical protein
MNEFDLLCKQNKTVDEIKLPTWNKIIEILDLSPDNDWENIGNLKNFFFSVYLNQKRKLINKNLFVVLFFKPDIFQNILLSLI